MPTRIDLERLVKRVVGRVMSERGSERSAEPAVARLQGVHVTAHPSGKPLRPEPERHDSPSQGRGPELVTVECLVDVEDGGRYLLPAGAIVTALAREEAWRRRITLLSNGGLDRSTREDGRLRVALGADHGGFALKKSVIEWMREMGHVALDFGTHDENAVDYPDLACAVAEAVAQGRADFGICIDGAGIGSAMAANKVPGVRAANCWDVAGARNAREHNFANVLTLGGKTMQPRTAYEVVRTFLTTREGEERHARRVQKLSAIEERYVRAPAQNPTKRSP